MDREGGVAGVRFRGKGVYERAGAGQGDGIPDKEMGRWNSGLVAFVFKCLELCKRHHAEFRAQTLPAGVSALLQLSQAVPEKKDAVRGDEKSPFFERLGLTVIGLSKGATEMLTFVGESVVFFGQAVAEDRAISLVRHISGDAGVRAEGAWDCCAHQFSHRLDPCVRRRRSTSEIRRGNLHRRPGGDCDGAGDGLHHDRHYHVRPTGAAFAAQLGTMKVNQEIRPFGHSDSARSNSWCFRGCWH